MKTATVAVISLGERPILLLHQPGFATHPCCHGASHEAFRVAAKHTTALFTFDHAEA